MEMLNFTDLIGVPYKDNGRSIEEGFDCYGLAIEVERRLGNELVDVVYSDHALQLVEEHLPTLNVVKTDKIETGVLLQMTFFEELHIGVAIDEKIFIHATINQGVRISPIKCYKVNGIFKVVNKNGNNQSL